MLTLWFHLILYRFSRSREADKGKNKGKITVQNEITPGGGMTEICGFMRSSFKKEAALICTIWICGGPCRAALAIVMKSKPNHEISRFC